MTKAATKPKTQAQRQLGRIHILATKLGLDDETYRALLLEHGGKASSKDLDALGRAKVLDHLTKLAGEDPMRPSTEEIAADPQIAKINALLADAKRPWSYLLAKGGVGGQSLLQRLTRKDRLRFCAAADLGKVIAALEIDKKRREARNA